MCQKQPPFADNFKKAKQTQMLGLIYSFLAGQLVHFKTESLLSTKIQFPIKYDVNFHLSGRKLFPRSSGRRQTSVNIQNNRPGSIFVDGQPILSSVASPAN